MILDKYTLLEAARICEQFPQEFADDPVNRGQQMCADTLRALAAEQPENSQQVGIVQVLPLGRTPETDAIDATADQNYGTDMYRDMLGHARRLERELAAAQSQLEAEQRAHNYWQHEFYRVEKMVEAEQDRVEELERQLAAAQSRLDAAKEAIDFLHWMESAAPKTLETLESWREQFEYATNSKLSADKRGDSGS